MDGLSAWGQCLTKGAGFAVCVSKLSDIYGRRNMLVVSWVFFVGFSQGCGSAKSMTGL